MCDSDMPVARKPPNGTYQCESGLSILRPVHTRAQRLTSQTCCQCFSFRPRRSNPISTGCLKPASSLSLIQRLDFLKLQIFEGTKPRHRPGLFVGSRMSALGHSLQMYSTPFSNNVRYASDSGRIVDAEECRLSAIRDHFIRSKCFDRTHIHGTHVPAGGAVHSQSGRVVYLLVHQNMVAGRSPQSSSRLGS
jgi:hypothetical protein